MLAFLKRVSIRVLPVFLCLFTISCSANPSESTTSSTPAATPFYMVQWYTPLIQAGYAFYNASGEGLMNIDRVDSFFNTDQRSPLSFLGVIELTDEGDPIIYEVSFEDGLYSLQIDSTHDKFGSGDQDILTGTYEHSAVIPGKVRGRACVLYNGDQAPSFDDWSTWADNRACVVAHLP